MLLGGMERKEMLIRLEEHSMYAEINGFKEVRIEDTGVVADIIRRLKRRDVSVQFLNAELVATWEHLRFAVLNAIVAFANNCNISKKLEVEVILYASAQRQIRKAIDLIGVKRGCLNWAVVIVGGNEASVKATLSEITERLGKKPDETVLDLSESKVQKIRRVFGISEIEIEATASGDAEHALINLVIERMALLAASI